MYKNFAVADHFIRVAEGTTFEHELFKRISNTSSPILFLTNDTYDFPAFEMLARDPKGQRLGSFFEDVRKSNRMIDTDLPILKNAVRDQLKLNKPVSINLNVETFFSPRLFATLNDLATQYPKFNPKMICLEITEQGGIPKNFNPAALIALKKMGFKLALDDFDPRNPEEQKRLKLFADYVDIVKYPHEVMAHLRDGSITDAVDFADEVRSISLQYPRIQFVMEGLRASDEKMLPVLEKANIRYGQVTKHVDTPKTTVTNKVDFPLFSFGLAQPA